MILQYAAMDMIFLPEEKLKQQNETCLPAGF